MRQNETDETIVESGLTERQVAALPYIVAGATLSEGARLASVGRATLYRWVEDDQFRSALERTRSEAAELARTELEGLMLKAVLVLAESLEDPSPNVRLRAANAALALGLKTLDVKDLRRRLDHLDDAMTLLEKKRPNYSSFGLNGGA